ncbi:hypothetical protein BH11ACT8_BH11ACT8_35100 [soil metagenome]
MKTHVAAGVAALALLTLGACGDQTDPGTVADPGSSQVPGTPSSDVSSASSGIEHATGADDVVLRVFVGGGFVAADYAFTNQPSLLVTGDGRVFLPAADEGVDGQRLASLRVVQGDEDTIQQVLALAQEHGLLSKPPSYEDTSGPLISDAPTTSVLLNAAGGSFEHDAYALSFGAGSPTEAEQGDRAELAAFIDEATALFADTESSPYEPSRLRLRAEAFGGEPGNRSTVVAWPSVEPPVDLASVADSGCVAVPAEGLVDALSSADFSTYFRQGGEVYTVSAAAVLPGEEPCSGSERGAF